MTEHGKAAARPAASRRRAVFQWIGIMIAAVLLIGGIIVVRAWDRPLGPALVLSEPSPTLASIPAFDEISPLVGTTQPMQEPQCGGPPVMFILLVGKDTDDENYETGFADVIRIARVDFVNPSVSVLSIPRDLSVRMPGLEQHQIIEARLKTAYAYGYAYDVPGGGPSLLAQALVENFGFQLDHYAVANYVAFEQAIDAIGGVDVYLAAPIADYSSGWVHMDGQDALRYARLRKEMADPSDLNRIDRQTQVLDAVRQRVMSPQVLSNLPALIASIQDMVLTDMSPADISLLTCLSDKMEGDSIQLTNLDRKLFTSQIDAFGFEILLPEYAAIRAEADRFEAGQVMSNGSIPK